MTRKNNRYDKIDDDANSSRIEIEMQYSHEMDFAYNHPYLDSFCNSIA